MSHKGAISGHIYQADGTPLTGEVNVFCAPLDPDVHITHGDPAPPALSVKAYGEYRIDNLPSSSYAVLAVAADQTLFPEKPVIVSVGNRGNTNQDLVLIPGGSITGQVTGIEPEMTKSKPFTVECIIEPEGLGWAYFISSTPVAEDGTYSLENAAPGNIRIYVNNGWGPGSYHAESSLVDVRSGERTKKDFTILK